MLLQRPKVIQMNQLVFLGENISDVFDLSPSALVGCRGSEVHAREKPGRSKNGESVEPMGRNDSYDSY